MEIDAKGWAGQLYRFSCRVWQRFTGRDNLKYQLNVCRYIRLTCFYMPLALVFSVLLDYWAFYVLLYWPIVTFGWGYGWFWLTILGIVVLICVLLLLISTVDYFQDSLDSGYKRVKQTRAASEIGQFWRLFRQYCRDKHDKVCTVINVKGRYDD